MAVAPKAKRRNSEKRKEHSRDAARHRRSREAEVFLNLAEEIPLAYDLVKLLDKTSIIRLTITYLKLRSLLNKESFESESGIGNGLAGSHLEQKLDQLYQRVLDGFVMFVASDGDILFVTDNVVGFLGLTQIDVMGQSIFDMSHPCDHEEIREMIGVKSHQPSDNHRGIFIRMKSTITSKGRNVHIKSASYRVISCSGHLKTSQMSMAADESVSFVVIICQSIAHPSNIEVPLDSQTFVSRHSLDMKFSECDDRICELIGYCADEVIGKSIYGYFHALDVEMLERTFKTLFCKGQATTGLYRFLAKHGGYVWIETQATVINNAVTDKPEYIVCLNYVISEVESKDTVFDAVQLCSKMVPLAVEEMDSSKYEDPEKVCPDAYQDDEDGDQSCIQFVTEKILEQAAKDREESDCAMLQSMTRYLLDPSMPSNDQSFYSVDKPLGPDGKTPSEVAGGNDDDLGMTKNLSNSSLTSLLDKIDDEGMEMRAPYISMDDLVFSSIDTPSSQPYVPGPQLSCLMNSDPLLPSVGRVENPLLMKPFFTMNTSECRPTFQHPNPSAEKSSGTKRAYAGADAIDLTAAPRKAPRLELNPAEFGSFGAVGLPSSDSSRPSATVSTVTMMTGPVTHVQPLTTDSPRNGLKPNTYVVGSKTEQQAKFLQATKLREATEKIYPTAASGAQKSEGAPATIYLVWDGQQLNPMTLRSDQVMDAGSIEFGQDGFSEQPMTEEEEEEEEMVPKSTQSCGLLQANVGDKVVVYGDGDASQSGNFVLNLTNRGDHAVKMVGTSNFSVRPAGGGTPVVTTFMDSNGDHKTVVYTFGRSGANQKSLDQMVGQPEACRQNIDQPRAVDRQPCPVLTSGQILRLISSSARKTMQVLPTPKAITSAKRLVPNVTQDKNALVGAAQGQYCALDLGSGSRASDGGSALPLHLQVRGGSGNGGRTVPRMQLSSDLLGSTLQLESGAEQPMSSEGSLSAGLRQSFLNGIGARPLHTLQQEVGAGQARSDALRHQFVVPPTDLATKGLRMPKPGTQVIVRNAGQQMAALRGISLQGAAPRTDGCYMVIRRGVGEAPEVDYAQSLTAPCAGAVLDSSGSSVLMNLLMKGVDVNYGYRLESRPVADSQKQMTMG